MLDSPSVEGENDVAHETYAKPASERKAHSFCCHDSLEELHLDKDRNTVDQSSAIPHNSASVKAVQLIKWKDLPGKDEYNSSKTYLISTSSTDSDSTHSKVGSSYRGSDIVNFVVQQQQEDRRLESENKDESTKEENYPNTVSIRSVPLVKSSSKIVISTAF